jgi:Spy/CpxP family protein refolding chaperone
MKKAIQGLIITGFLMVGAIGIASATLPEPQDPQVVANMTFEQRLQMSKDLREQFQKATPEERREYRQKLHAKFKALSPEERKALREKMHAQWKALTPEQKKELRDNRKAMIEDLTPGEREEMKKQREDWKKNHPNGKGGWNAPMTN